MKKDKSLKFNVEVVRGQCPTCTEHTMLVNIDKEYYRCITCGTDLEQRVNGKISYIPIINTSLKDSIIFTTGKSSQWPKLNLHTSHLVINLKNEGLANIRKV
jgi:uncharacterized protein (DUF983 family)